MRGVMKERARLVADTHLVLTDPDGLVLMMVRDGTGFMDGHAGLPAGHVEAGEAVDAAILREAEEEIGVVIDPADLTFAHVMHRRPFKDKPTTRASFFFTASRWAGTVVNAEPHKCSRLLWVDSAALPGSVDVPVIPYIVDALASIRAGRPFSIHGWRDSD